MFTVFDELYFRHVEFSEFRVDGAIKVCLQAIGLSVYFCYRWMQLNETFFIGTKMCRGKSHHIQRKSSKKPRYVVVFRKIKESIYDLN